MGSQIDPYTSAKQMLTMLASKEISAVELLEFHIDRIARHNPKINAIVWTDLQQARATAIKTDETRVHGHTSALLGLPITIKDSIDVKDVPGTGGIEKYADRRPLADSLLVSRLKREGAVIIGKTNVPEHLSDWQSNNPIYGRSNNPWDPDKTPGGSTGGGAAALATGLTALEFGSDIGGSIRIPASFCGVYGHKPSETAVPRSGHFPGSTKPNPGIAMVVQGPLARTADDIELSMNVVSGPDINEDKAWTLHMPTARHSTLSEYRVAIMPVMKGFPVDAKIAESLQVLASILEKAGVRVREAQPVPLPQMHSFHELYAMLLTLMTSINLPVDSRRSKAEKMLSSDSEFARSFSLGLTCNAADYLLALNERERFRQLYTEFFDDWDILLSPITMTLPFEHTSDPWPQRTISVNGEEIEYGRQVGYPSLATLTGNPATSFPVDLIDSALPIGLQAIGPYLEDYTSIGFSKLVAQEIGGFKAPPGYDN